MEVNNIRSFVGYATIGLVGLTSLSFLTLFSPTALADTDVITTTTINVPVSCTMEGTNNTAHTATLLNGMYSGTDYTNGIGTTTLRVFCNDNAGYAIYAIGYTNNEYGNTLLHWNKAANASDTTNDIDTGIYDSTDPTDSTWSVKLASSTGTYITTISDGTNNDEDYTDWHVIPDEYERVAYKTSGTDIQVDNTGTGSSITVTYDAYISTTQPAGAYIGQVKYTLVHPHTAPAPMTPLDPSKLNITNAIIYAPNTSDIVGSMSTLPQTSNLSNAPSQAGAISATANSTTTLIAPNFKRSGYGFAGWSTEFDAKAAYDAGKTITVYGPNETISTNPTNGGLDVTGGAVLYPVWVESKGNLQGWTGCSSLTPASYDSTTGALTATLSSITALTDTRDNNVYTVARLADGQCWMVENLRLDSAHSSDSTKAQLYGNATTSINASGRNLGRFVGLANSEDANFGNNTTANSLYSIDGSNGTININSNSSYYPGYRLPRYNNNNTNMATNATNSAGTTLEDKYDTYGNATDDNHLRWYGYGNYYNWSAAIANTEYFTTYSGNNGSDAAGTSICPTGWHLPLGYKSTGTLTGTVADDALVSSIRVGSFSYLDRRMGGTGASSSTNSVTSASMSTYWRKFPNNFVYSGSWNGARASDRSTYGYYWSSSASSLNYAYYPYFYSSNVNPGTITSFKYNGFSVRCIAGS